MRPVLRRAVVVAFTAWLLAACGDDSSSSSYSAELRPLNSSGVEGKARFEVKDGRIEVTIDASGLAGNRIHEQQLVTGGDDGEPCGGSTMLDLDPYPTVGDDGKLSYEHAVEVDPDKVKLSDASLAIYGKEVRGRYRPEVPVACGKLGK